tara:strand:- start:135 stop:359 length:225 start_codon:yes stop_codon:yes gene_type:complete
MCPLKLDLNPIIVWRRRVLPTPFGPVTEIDCPEVKSKLILSSITLPSTAHDKEFIEIEIRAFSMVIFMKHFKNV